MPGVLAVITGKDLEAAGLHWMPTLAGDKQMVLPVDTVMYQSQEVAAVIALTRYQAADAIAAVNVDYEPLEVVVDPFKSLEPGAPVLRPDRGPDKANNHIWHWESGDRGRRRRRSRRRRTGIITDGASTSPHPRRVDRDLRLHRRLRRRRPATSTSTSRARRRMRTAR